MPRQQAEGHKWFAAVYDRLMAAAEKSSLGKVRQEVAGGARGRVLEIGCGTGANFSYYRDDANALIATDPDPYMLKRAKRKAAAVNRPIEIYRASAEALPFRDRSFDTVVSTINMCTIPEPAKALAEVKRVLKPGGEFRFYDHVRYDHAFGAFWQDLVTPLWRWLGAGCHPNRDVERFIREAGFTIREMERLKPYPPIPPVAFTRPHIKGVAIPGETTEAKGQG